MAKTLTDTRTHLTDPNGRFHQADLPMPLPGPRYVGIRTEALYGNLSGTIVALLNGPAHPLGGGGIDPQSRNQRRPLTPYHSPDALGLSLSIILNGYNEGRSVEFEYRLLQRMAGMFVPDDPGPVPLIVVGQAVPHCRPAEAYRHRWLISEQPQWEDDTIRVGRGAQLRRQTVGLTLLKAAKADDLERLKPRQPKPNFDVEPAREEDTYLKIARRKLGSERLGRKLAELNGDKDPRKQLRKGQNVRLPSAHLLDLWKRDLKIGK